MVEALANADIDLKEMGLAVEKSLKANSCHKFLSALSEAGKPPDITKFSETGSSLCVPGNGDAAPGACGISVAPTTIRVIIPLAIRKRNGRPKIMPPSNPVEANEAAVEADVLRAVAKAWSRQRKLEAGKASTNLDLAHVEDVSDRYIGRMIKLAYLAPAVLEKLLLQRCPLAVSFKDLTAIADLPWADQIAAAFGSPVDRA